MRFWDSSAIVPLLVQEAESDAMRALLRDDPDVVVWALTGLEVTSALWRRARAGELTESARTAAATMLSELEQAWNMTIDVVPIAARARRVLAVHPTMRAADACQLAAALLVCRERTDSLEFVTLDDRLADAARREGIRVLPASP